MKEIKIAGKVYTFKENLSGLDLLATFEEDSTEYKTLKATVALIARASQKPKLSNKNILMLPYGEFIIMIKEFSALYGVPGELDFLDEK